VSTGAKIRDGNVFRNKYGMNVTFVSSAAGGGVTDFWLTNLFLRGIMLQNYARPPGPLWKNAPKGAGMLSADRVFERKGIVEDEGCYYRNRFFPCSRFPFHFCS